VGGECRVRGDLIGGGWTGLEWGVSWGFEGGRWNKAVRGVGGGRSARLGAGYGGGHHHIGIKDQHVEQQRKVDSTAISPGVLSTFKIWETNKSFGQKKKGVGFVCGWWGWFFVVWVGGGGGLGGCRVVF